ncbi:MAG: vWA domain-containing protein [Dermatophilaceae bacterium]
MASTDRARGRHARGGPGRRQARSQQVTGASFAGGSDGPPLGILLIVALVVVGLIAVVAVRAQREDATVTGPAPCTDAVTVSAPPGLSAVVDGYAATGDGCAAATMVTSASADVRILDGSEARVPDTALSEPVASSPVVLAMTEQAAGAVGAPTVSLSDDELRAVLAPGAWASRGTPEWGEFRIRVPEPAVTALGATGVSALVGTLVGSSTATVDQLPAAVSSGALGALARAAQAVPPEEALFPEVADTAQFTAASSAVVTTEAALGEYLRGEEALPLVGVVIGNGAAHVPVRVRGSAPGLVDYLLSNQGQELLRAAGYYGANGAPPTERGPVAVDLLAEEPLMLDDRELVAAPALLGAALQPRDVVVLVDTAAAMAEPVTGAASRQEALAAAAEGVVPVGADVRVSLWLGTAEGATQALTAQPATDETLAAVRNGISAADIGGNPDLAAAIREALAFSLVYAREPDRELVLLVVVPAGRELTDEQEADVTGYLRSAVRPDQQLRLSVVSVGGPASDLDTLVTTGRGVAAPAPTADDLPAALTAAVVGR